ncbi:hypothetical protein PT974_09986 [Cladobotryum mycophilum]|uniref:NWD NACHT-NTPase N-terminal domain-containing protein n=1 Tax=Cladobotryum mycophilum TaxID=491253 RepID=A0ABR0S8K3_9HYPO
MRQFLLGKIKEKLSRRGDKDKAVGASNIQPVQEQSVVPASGNLPDPIVPGTCDDPPQPTTSQTASLNPGNGHQDNPISELWNSAYEKLREQDGNLVQRYEDDLKKNLNDHSALDPKAHRREWMDTVLRQKMAEVQENMWKFSFGNSDIPVAELVQPVFRVAKLANNFITTSIIPSPYTSMAWVGTSALLSFLLRSTDQPKSLAKGLEYISMLISQTMMREDLYHRYYESKYSDTEPLTVTHLTYKSTLEELYRRILKFQVTCYCYYADHGIARLSSDFAKMNNWDSLIEKIREQERQMAIIHQTWRDGRYDRDRAAAEERQQETINSLTTIGADIASWRKAIEDNTLLILIQAYTATRPRVLTYRRPNKVAIEDHYYRWDGKKTMWDMDEDEPTKPEDNELIKSEDDESMDPDHDESGESDDEEHMENEFKTLCYKDIKLYLIKGGGGERDRDRIANHFPRVRVSRESEDFHWRKDILNTPIFRQPMKQEDGICCTSKTEALYYNTYRRDLRKLGMIAGFRQVLKLYAIRRGRGEAIKKVRTQGQL